MPKLIPDIIVNLNVEHKKFDKQAEMWAQWQEVNSEYYKSQSENNDVFDPNFKLGDLVWGYKFNNEIVEGFLQTLDPGDKQGLYYLIVPVGQKTGGWCSKIQLVNSLKEEQELDSKELEYLI